MKIDNVTQYRRSLQTKQENFSQSSLVIIIRWCVSAVCFHFHWGADVTEMRILWPSCISNRSLTRSVFVIGSWKYCLKMQLPFNQTIHLLPEIRLFFFFLPHIILLFYHLLRRRSLLPSSSSFVFNGGWHTRLRCISATYWDGAMF